jgi:LPXTG-motif cell wall-anchored protein
MRRKVVWLCVAAGACVLSLGAGTASAQQKTTETKRFEVVSVDGNKVVAKTVEGAKEYTVPEDFRFTVDGKQVSVHELKPGMKGTATITTTTTVTPVSVTEVRNGEVVQATGNSLLVKGPNGFRMFTEGDVQKRGVKIFKGGQPVAFTDLHTGDKLTATIVTEHPPKVMTERQVKATLSGAPAAAATPTPTAAAPPPPPPPAGTAGTTPATGTAKPARKLPKTGSPLPLVGGLGAMSLAAGALLTALRRRRAVR